MTFKQYLKAVSITIVPLLAVICVMAHFVVKISNPIAAFAVTVVFAILVAYPFTKYIEWLIDKGIL